MKGDFSRLSHAPDRHYASLLLQQGRVGPLDADWNEQIDIENHRLRVQTIDTVGRACAPTEAAGFEISLTPDGHDLVIGEGRIYVGGILVETRHDPWVEVLDVAGSQLTLADMAPEGRRWVQGQWIEVAGRDSVAGSVSFVARVARVRLDDGTIAISRFGTALPDVAGSLRVRRLLTYLTQPYFPATADPPFSDPFAPELWGGLRTMVYLDVWQRHVTAVEDPHIREVALGGPDTATRVQTVWSVRILFEDREAGLPFDAANVGCQDQIPLWDQLTAESAGRMSARAEIASDPDDPCLIRPEAGYRGLENRLYRVEIHTPGPLGTATMKWSRDNGSVLAGITNFPSSDRIELQSLGRDAQLRFGAGDRVEVLSDDSELSGQPGRLTRIVGDPQEEILDLVDEASEFVAHRTPKLRRWDQPDEDITTSEDWTLLDAGVQVRFHSGPFSVGDYWVIPARVATGDVEGFTESAPRGIEHNFARLALVTWPETENGSRQVDDCRRTFPSLCELPSGGQGCASVTVGDGITSVGDFTEIQGAIDSLPVEGPSQLSIGAGTYFLSEPVRVRHNRLTITGCGLQSRLVANTGSAFRIESSVLVVLAALTIDARAPDGAVVVEESRDIRIESCTISNGLASGTGDALNLTPGTTPGGPRAPLVPVDAVGPAVAVTGSALLSLHENRLMASPAASLQARGIAVIGNQVCGSLSIRDGSRYGRVCGNDVFRGRGPGVTLGGVGDDEPLPSTTTGVRQVEICHNRIQNMGGSGVATPSSTRPRRDLTGPDVIRANLPSFEPVDFERVVSSFDRPPGAIAASRFVVIAEDDDGALALGDVTDVTIADNLIADCGGAGPDAAYDADAVGGVVLREVTRARICRNDITGNGAAPAGGGRGCGVFLRGCESVEVSGNRIVGNGGRGGGLVDLTGGRDALAPNPVTLGGFTFRQPRAQTNEVAAGTGFGVRRSAIVSLPEPSDRVELALVARAGGRVSAVNAAGDVLVTRTYDEGGPRLVFEGDAISAVTIEAESPSTVSVMSVITGRSPGTYQGGIIGLALSDSTPGSPAATVLGNHVSCPAGQALLLSGAGPMTVTNNYLSSLGSTLQASGVAAFMGTPGAVELMPKTVYLFNAGVTPGYGNRPGGAGSATVGRTIRAREVEDAETFPIGGSLFSRPQPETEFALMDTLVADLPDREPDGQVMFHGNQVLFRPEDEPEDTLQYAMTSMTIGSFGDVLFNDNQLSVETSQTMMLTNTLVSGVTVRASGNRWTEPLHRATWSAILKGLWLASVTGNQATHCLSVSGVLDRVAANQVLLEELDEGACERRTLTGNAATFFTSGGDDG